jgi:hypothetical protein
MQIHCPRCGVTVPGVDIDISTKTAVCRPCGEVFPFPVMPGAAPASVAVFSTPAITIHKPSDLHWHEIDEFNMRGVAVPMKRAVAVALAFFALFWDGFLVFWYSTALHLLTSGKAGGEVFIMLLFPLLHVGAGAFITYRALCGIFNTAYVRFDREAFRFERRPIPMRGKVSEPTDGISGFEPLEKNARSRRGVSSTWDVNLLTTDGRAVRVAFGFSEHGHAAYAASRLEQLLEAVKQPKLPYRA